MSPFRRRILLAGLLLGGAGLRAELASTSPFVPQGATGLAATADNPLELRGVMAEGQQLKFSIFDPAKKSGTWVGLNEPGHDFAVKKYDENNDTVILDYQGRTLNLTLRAAKVASSGAAVPPMPAVGPVGAPPVAVAPNPVTRNVVANPTPATEAARLADWQAEIQRRRELRAQQAATTPVATTPAPSAPPPADAASAPGAPPSARPRATSPNTR